MTQAEPGQIPEKIKEDMKSVTVRSNATDTHIGSASGENAEKAGQKAGSVRSRENRQCYKTKREKHRFIRESIQLDTNPILNVYAKLKETVIKLFFIQFQSFSPASQSIWQNQSLRDEN